MSDPPPSAETKPSWRELVQSKRERRLIEIKKIMPKINTVPKDKAERITSIDNVETLASKIAAGEFTVVDVTLAYIQKAITAHEKTNCLTEIMFHEACVQAAVLDVQLESSTKKGIPPRPLHGIPITLKDQFDVHRYDTTLGYVGRSFRSATDDSLLVKILKDAGAIIIAKTNLPQSIMWCETDNPLWGLTTNPMDPELTPGGSTGGEACLLHQHGSLIGWGTDIGGSVRIPAHMMGLYALKPSSGRLPYLGCQVSTAGQEHVPSVIGPMARSLESIETVTKIVIEAQPWNEDPTCHRLPWQQHIYEETQSRKLVIGLLLDDGHVRPHPSIERVVRNAVAKLKAAGHTIVDWTSDLHTQCIDIMDKYYTADGGKDIRDSIAEGGEPMIPHVQALVDRGQAIPVYAYWQLNKMKRDAQTAYLEKWNKIQAPDGRRVDILLTPVMPHPAVPHKQTRWVGYTKVWNLLDYTAVVLPGDTVDKNIDYGPNFEHHDIRNPTDDHNWNLYDPEKQHGLPIGIQLVGQRLEEEKVLGAAKVVEEVLRGKKWAEVVDVGYAKKERRDTPAF